MKLIYIFAFTFRLFYVICVSITPVMEPGSQTRSPSGRMETIVYRTVNKYYCTAENVPGASLLMYGTDAWSFPEQDVNLTLRYPSTNSSGYPHDKEYIITGFKVILHLDSQGSKGFIVHGGILQDTITLAFTSSAISMMQYQLWIYGISKNVTHLNSAHFRLCD